MFRWNKIHQKVRKWININATNDDTIPNSTQLECVEYIFAVLLSMLYQNHCPNFARALQSDGVCPILVHGDSQSGLIRFEKQTTIRRANFELPVAMSTISHHFKITYKTAHFKREFNQPCDWLSKLDLSNFKKSKNGKYKIEGRFRTRINVDPLFKTLED